jgi:hypothetical protein
MLAIVSWHSTMYPLPLLKLLMHEKKLQMLPGGL